MARSIANRQADYLKTVHLDQIGEAKNVMQSVQLEEVERAMLDLAILFKVLAEEGLNAKQAIDSGKLAESIQFDQVQFAGGVYSVDINVLDYYDFVNKGVKGTKNKSLNSPYSFKNNYVSVGFMTSIRKWLIRHGMKSSAKPVKAKGGKFALGTERKTINFQERSNAMAYAIATSIKKKGLKATGFWDNAESKVEKEMQNTLGNAFAIGIVNQIASK